MDGIAQGHTVTGGQARPYDRRPDMATASTLADEFLLLACLRYSPDDGEDRWRRASALLDAHPEIRTATVHTAAACADVGALRRLLGADRTLVRTDGGPFDWPPLLYLTYARHDAAVTEAAAVGAARLLLDAGADPNAGYLWDGESPPFTALTGALGGGERGEDNQPRHPHSIALARLLLEAGANPNDGQALYNRMFGRDDDHLTLLLEFGLGRGDREPWTSRRGAGPESPASLLGDQLGWAILHEHHARIALLLDRGAEPDRRLRNGRTPLELATVYGKTHAARLLTAAGATGPELDPVDRLMAAGMIADRPTAAALVDAQPGLAAAAAARHPSAILRATGAGNADAVQLLAELGFDVNALGRADLPIEEPWETALHASAGAGNRDLVVLLLGLGADPSVSDQRFGSTPAAWAAHFGHSISELEAPPPERA
ncbi:ankyrin repeat domain-containing protein [Rhodococcus daqingensis]|uniref:Ankyrin repeat domain-containing protein n=1 Tax=Rhodococcus daqingensis TaxID=2479363 RepID=A0ABW2RTV8_9NOCA